MRKQKQPDDFAALIAWYNNQDLEELSSEALGVLSRDSFMVSGSYGGGKIRFVNVTLPGLLLDEKPSRPLRGFRFGSKLKRPSYARCLDLAGLWMPKQLRARVYEPTSEELKEEYVLARRKYRTKWARRSLVFGFGFRTVLLFIQCSRALITDTAFQAVLKLVPEPIKRWWIS